MFNLFKKSLVIKIDNFVEFFKFQNGFKRDKKFYKKCFCSKRLKINPEVFNHLSEVIIVNTYIDGNTSIKLFEGFRLLDVDGSKITLPYNEDLKKKFGESKNSTNTSVVQGRSSFLYDVLNRIALDSSLENFA